MIGRGLRLLGEWIAYPFGALTRAVHRKATGERAILEVDVRSFERARDAAVRWRGLRRVAKDPRVKGVWLYLHESPGGWATASDLRRVIKDLRTAGKQVHAFVLSPGNALLWIAAACDRVTIAPGGELYATGVGMQLNMLGAALEMVGVEADLESAGEYKSFGETFTRRFASDQNREALESIARSLQGVLERDVAAGRGVTVEAVREAFARAPLGPDEAVERGLIDAVGYEDASRTAMEQAIGGEVGWRKYGGWAFRDRMVGWFERFGTEGHVAVLHLEGAVVMEDASGRPAVRAPEVMEALRELKEDEAVRAVVLHVSSPGGSALASDLIWREVGRLAEDKPVLASFSDVAASGGYYLAAGVKEIFARPTTLTGSIGVVGGKMVVAGTLQKLGVTTQSVAMGPHATMMSPAERFTPSQRVRFRASLKRIYDGFVQRVADGRGCTPAEIEPVCRGRVWTGEDALERNLVDQLGDLSDAVQRAATLGGVSPTSRVDLVADGPAAWWLAMRAILGPRLMARTPFGLRVEEVPGMSGAVQAAQLLARHPMQAMTWLPWVIERDGSA